MKISKNFLMQEFLTPEDYNEVIKSENPETEFYKLIDKNIVIIAQFLRELIGKPLVVNNWHVGGKFSLRGRRPLKTKIGARFSMHKQGKAFDFSVEDISSKEIKKIVIENQIKLYELGARRMESHLFSPTWCHIDLKDNPKIVNKLHIFVP